MQPRKQHLIETALTLFNKNGFHATGIDLILAESGVSKATLYKHFRSKDELILAVLQQRHEQVLMTMNSKLEEAKLNKENPILAIFDGLHEWFTNDTFFGCNFINASAEYAESNHSINLFSTQHKQSIEALIIKQLASQENYQGELSVEMRAQQIDLLIEGAIVMAHTRHIKNAALTAKQMALHFL